MRKSLVVIALACAVLFGCGDERTKSLQTTLDAYQAAIRWGDFANAGAFIHPDERPKPQQMNFLLQRFEQVRITSYQVQSQGAGPQPGTIINVAQMRVANRHTAHERMLTDRQVWRYDEEIKRWWLISGLPDISQR